MKKTFTLKRVMLSMLPLLGMLAWSQPANADDTRTVVTLVEATWGQTLTYGGTFKSSPLTEFEVTTGTQAHFSYNSGNGDWYRVGENTSLNGTTIHEGNYYLKLQIRIDSPYGSTHRLPTNKEDLTVRVDGVEWTVASNPMIYDGFSFVWVKSPTFVVEAPAYVPLSFDITDKNVKKSEVGTAITSFSVANYAIGGTGTYTFSKVSGPDWINVAADGTISGTPTAVAAATTLTIRVTDEATPTPNAAEETIEVREVINRAEISTIGATMSGLTLEYGKAYTEPTFNVTTDVYTYFSETMTKLHQKTVSGEISPGTIITEGTYWIAGQARIESDEYKLSTPSPTLTVNGTVWTPEIEYPFNGFKDGYPQTGYSCLYYNSPEIAVFPLADNTDNDNKLGQYNTKLSNVTLSGRTIYKDGRWNSLCLPFALATLTGTPLEGAKVKTLTSYSNDGTTVIATFGNDLTAIEAGKPYVVKFTSGGDNITDPSFNNVTIDNTGAGTVVCGDATFTGCYSPVELAAGDKKKLFLQNSRLYYPQTAANINAFRAYLSLSADVPTTPGARIIVDFGDGETTSISAIDAASETTGKCYDLTGRQVAQPSKGVYVVNGKKVIK